MDPTRTAPLTQRERILRGLLAALLAVVVYRLAFSGGAVNVIESIGASVIGLAALFTAATGRRLHFGGVDENGALAYVAMRLFVGLAFLHAGWEKLTGPAGWVGDGQGDSIKGFLSGVGPNSVGEHPASPLWFADLTDKVFLSHVDILSYLIVFGELAVGLGLILGIMTKTAAFFGVTMNLVFLFAGSTGGGSNPEMLVAGMILVLAAGAGVYALTVDRLVSTRTDFKLGWHDGRPTWRDANRRPSVIAIAIRAAS